MPTRLDLRTDLRLRLEDTGLEPLWDDDTLNAAIRNALVRFGARVPLEARLEISIPADQREIEVIPGLPRARVISIVAQSGQEVPEVDVPHTATSGEGLAWRWFGGTLILNRELSTSETWTLEYRAVRAMPTDDSDEIAITDEDAPLVISLAAEAVLRRRAIEEVKRTGNAAGVIAVADLFAAESRDLFRSRNRSVRSGVLTGVR